MKGRLEKNHFTRNTILYYEIMLHKVKSPNFIIIHEIFNFCGLVQ